MTMTVSRIVCSRVGQVTFFSSFTRSNAINFDLLSAMRHSIQRETYNVQREIYHDSRFMIYDLPILISQFLFLISKF